MPFEEASLSNHDWLPLISTTADTPIIFLLESEEILSRHLSLPLEAEKNLAELLGYDIDRFVPMPMGDLYYDYLVKNRNKTDNKIEIVLYVVQRDKLEQLVKKLSLTGLPINAIDFVKEVDEGFSRQGINLLPANNRHYLPKKQFSTNLVLTAVCLCILVIAQSTSLHLKEQRLSQWSQYLDSLNNSTKELAALVEQVDEAKRSALYLVNKRQQTMSINGALHRLTQTLPDNAYIQQLYIKENEIELHGLSESASSLIPLLEDAPWFYDSTLRAPIVQDGNTQNERYKIRLKGLVDKLNNYDDTVVVGKEEEG